MKWPAALVLLLALPAAAQVLLRLHQDEQPNSPVTSWQVWAGVGTPTLIAEWQRAQMTPEAGIGNWQHPLPTEIPRNTDLRAKACKNTILPPNEPCSDWSNWWPRPTMTATIVPVARAPVLLP